MMGHKSNRVTALGNDNIGGLSFTYGLETDDIIGNSYVFNAHDAAWITFARNLYSACQTMYRNRESAGCFNTANFLNKLNDWQNARPERLWVADAQRKYLRPYEDNGTVTYLPMLAGKKVHQREQVKTYNAYYYASKYVSDMCTSQNIMVRGNTPTSGETITVVPPANTANVSMYINCYINVASTSYNVVARQKAVRGQTYEMNFSSIGSMGETELYFCTAPMITELSGLAHLYFKQNNFGMASNLQRLEIGSSLEGYENANLETLTIGNSRMLEYLDVRNCPNVSGTLDLSGCVSLSEVYLDNTSFSGVVFANNGLLETAHLPSPTAISMRGLLYLDDLTLASADNISTLRIENCEFAPTTSLTIDGTTTTQNVKDIIIALVEASQRLSRARLIGLDWTLSSTNILESLYRMAGIDDDGYDISRSVLTGEAYVHTMRSGLYNKYQEVWQYLFITYDTMIPQYVATFLNADGTPIYDVNGNVYTQWVDAGNQPYDPITMGYTFSIEDVGSPVTNEYDASEHNGEYYHDTSNGGIYLSNGSTWRLADNSDILTPTLEPSEQYYYSFKEWNTLDTIMTGNRDITAEYNTTTRTYTVRWWKDRGVGLLDTVTNIPYGTEIIYSGDLPTYTDDESYLSFRLFKGWDKSTGRVTGDMDVIAQWEVSSLPTAGTPMNEMTKTQIYAVCQLGQQDSYWDGDDASSYFDFNMGHNFDFSNVESIEIGENGDYELTGIPKDHYTGTSYAFDGNTGFTSDIKLFEEDSPAFTMAIDFQFANTTSGRELISMYENGSNVGFSLYHNGTAPMIRWGSTTTAIGYQKHRDIVVLRHGKGSQYLYIYSAGNETTDNRYRPEVAITRVARDTVPLSSEPITFGARRDGSGFSYNAKAILHWCKIWFDDLGADNCTKLASWSHERLRMEYWGKGKYNIYNSGGKVTGASFICNYLLGGINGRNFIMNSTNTNVGGWDASLMRQFLNGRFFDGMPYVLQAMIKTVNINTTAGNKSYDITESHDKIYLPSLREMNGSNADGYMSEIGTSDDPIAWFTGDSMRFKFKGIIRDYNGIDYSGSTEPSTDVSNTVQPYDIWQNGNNRYIFVLSEIISEYGVTPSVTADHNFADGDWIATNYWWERSPILGSAANFHYVSQNGSAGHNGTASSAYGVCPGFSI